MFYAFKTFQNFFGYIRMEILNYKKENIERNYLNSMWKKQFIKVKNRSFELEDYLIEWKDKELRDREVKSKIEELIVSKNDRFEIKKKKKKKRN